jgi:anti-anti-sigma factor
MPRPLSARLPPELVIRTAAALKAQLAPLVEGARVKLVLDGSEVTAVDAAGLQILLACEKALARAGGALVLSPCSAPLRRAIDLAGVSDRFGVIRAGDEA